LTAIAFVAVILAVICVYRESEDSLAEKVCNVIMVSISTPHGSYIVGIAANYPNQNRNANRDVSLFLFPAQIDDSFWKYTAHGTSNTREHAYSDFIPISVLFENGDRYFLKRNRYYLFLSGSENMISGEIDNLDFKEQIVNAFLTNKGYEDVANLLLQKHVSSNDHLF